MLGNEDVGDDGESGHYAGEDHVHRHQAQAIQYIVTQKYRLYAGDGYHPQYEQVQVLMVSSLHRVCIRLYNFIVVQKHRLFPISLENRRVIIGEQAQFLNLLSMLFPLDVTFHVRFLLLPSLTISPILSSSFVR